METLKHYWILNRPEDKAVMIMGELLPPVDVGIEVEKFNIKSLRKQLNDGNCFDVDLSHRENDILELYFTCNIKSDLGEISPYVGNRLVYAFVYKKEKWRKTGFDPFGNNLSSVKVGKILQPFMSVPI